MGKTRVCTSSPDDVELRFDPKRPESHSDVSRVVTESVHKRRWWILGVLCLGLTMVVADETILTVALPALRRSLGAETSDLQWVVNSFILVSAALLLPAGTLGDRFGRRRLLLLGLVLFGASSVYAMMAMTTFDLVAARVVGGIGAACIMPGTLSLLSSVFPPEERPTAIGIWSAVAGIGIMFAPVVGGWMLDHFWWGSVFMINLPLVALMLAGVVVVVPEARDPDHKSLDLMGAGLAGTGLCAASFALIEAPTRGWTSIAVITALTLAAGCLVWFVLHERRSSAPMLDIRLFTQRSFRTPVLVIVLVFAAWNASGFVMTQAFQIVRGMSAFAMGIMFVPASIGWAAAAPLTARIVKVCGTRRTLAGGLTISGVAMASWAMILPHGQLWIIGLLDGIGGTGIGVAMTITTDMILGSVPGEKSGVASGINEVTRMIGVALGISGFGSLLTTLFSRAGGGGTSPSRGMPHAVTAAFAHAASGTILTAAALVLTAMFVARRSLAKRPAALRGT